LGVVTGQTLSVKQPAVYLMASGRNGTIYTGVTSDLPKRVWQHKNGTTGFTARYDCKLLVWYELHGEMLPAIARGEAAEGRFAQAEAGADRSVEPRLEGPV
jgi:predicted GIY-YIG superfamily endonuclease